MAPVTQELLGTQQLKHWKCFIQPWVSPLLLPAAYRQSFPEPLNLEVPGMLLRSALAGNPLSRATAVPEAL